MADLSWLGGAINATSGLLGSLFTNQTNWLMNRDNIRLQKQTNSQNEALMREAWARDDSARQRMVSDLEAAGLSKWLAAGASPMTSSPISLTAPKNDFKADFDGLSHAYSNFLAAQQTEKQNDLLDKQGQIAQNNVEESEARARIAKHDADVMDSRTGVASNDPQYLKYLAEILKTVQDKNGAGSPALHYFDELANKPFESVKDVLAPLQFGPFGAALILGNKAGKTIGNKIIEKKESKKNKVYKPLSFSDFCKQNQIDLSTPSNQMRAAKLYNEYKKKFE